MNRWVIAFIVLVAAFIVGKFTRPVATDPTKASTTPSSPLEGSAGADSERSVEKLASVLQERRGYRRRAELTKLISNTRPQDFARLCNRLLASGNENIVELAASHWAQVDPDGMLAHFTTGAGKSDQFREGMLQILFSNWARHDPHAAMEAAVTQPGENRFPDAVMATYMKADTEAALTLAKKCANFIHGFEGRDFPFFDEHPIRASELIADLPHPSHQKDLAKQLVESWAITDPAAAVTWADSLGVYGSSSFLKSLRNATAAWAKVDPNAASEFVEGKAGRARAELSAAFAIAIADTDPATAIQWAATNLDGSVRNETLKQVTALVGKDDPGAAMELARNHLDGNAREAAYVEILNHLRDLPPTDAAAFIDTLSEDDWKRAETFEQFRKWASWSNHSASAFAADLPAGDAQASAYEVLTQIHYARDPEATARWIKTLPDGPGREAAARELSSLNASE
jgi:hypothetical protein